MSSLINRYLGKSKQMYNTVLTDQISYNISKGLPLWVEIDGSYESRKIKYVKPFGFIQLKLEERPGDFIDVQTEPWRIAGNEKGNLDIIMDEDKIEVSYSPGDGITASAENYQAKAPKNQGPSRLPT